MTQGCQQPDLRLPSLLGSMRQGSLTFGASSMAKTLRGRSKPNAPPGMTGQLRGPPHIPRCGDQRVGGGCLQFLRIFRQRLASEKLTEGEQIMAQKKVGQVITRPGRTVNHPDVVI